MVLRKDKNQVIADVAHDRNYVDFDEASEAAVERWLTSPASTSRASSCMMTGGSPSNSSTFGGSRHSHTGASNNSDIDSVTRSMSVAAAAALIEANATSSSPGGKFGTNSNSSQSAPGRTILRERLRQRVLKNEMSGAFDDQYSRTKYPTPESTYQRNQSGRSPAPQISAVSFGSSNTPQTRLETLLQDKGLLTKKRNPSTPSTASSATSPSSSDVLKSFVGADLVPANSSLTDGGRSSNSEHHIRHIQNQRNATNELSSDFVSMQLSSSRSPRRTPSSPPSSPRSRRKVSSKSSNTSGSGSVPSSPSRGSKSGKFHRQNSEPITSTLVANSPSIRRPESAKEDSDGSSRRSSAQSSRRSSNMRFFGRSHDEDSPSSRSSNSRASSVIPLQEEAAMVGNGYVVVRNITPSTLQSDGLREVKTFSPKSLARKPMTRPKSVASNNIVVESREQSDSSFRVQSRPVRYERRQTFSAPSRTNRIRLHIYDLIASETVVELPWGIHFPIGQCFNVVNSSLHQLGTGAYHVGVEVNGVEYAYGSNDARDTTGVFTCMPKHSPGYQYRTTIDFGERTLVRKVYRKENGSEISYKSDASNELRVSEREVDGREVLREMAREYKGTDYDLLRKNCCTFAHDAAVRLGVNEEEVPSWFRNLCKAGAVTQDAAVSTMQPISQVLSACDCDTNNDVPEYVANTGFEVISTEAKSGRTGRGGNCSVHGEGSIDKDGLSDLSTADKFHRTSSWRY